MKYFSDRQRTRIGLEIGNQHRAVGVCIDFSAYAPMFGKCGLYLGLKKTGKALLIT